MKYLGYAALLLIAIAAYSFKPSDKTETITPSSNIISKNFIVGTFNELDVSSAIAVKFIQSAGETKVVANGPDNLIDRLDISNKNGELTIKYKKNTNIRFHGIKDKNVTVEVVSPTLSEVELSGASSFSAPSLNTKNLSIDLSGASVFKVENLVATKTDIDLSGASTVKVKNFSGEKSSIELSGASTADMAGSLNTLKLELSGASTAKLANLVVDNGSVDATGASNAQTNIKNKNLHASGYSKVNNKSTK
ncbi:MAG: DUF2807 domain-containing protein [Muribaculaceae bacterium]|nr:DUF2807 domain-containing protein [Muribaculaceae bacterium]